MALLFLSWRNFVASTSLALQLAKKIHVEVHVRMVLNVRTLGWNLPWNNSAICPRQVRNSIEME